LAVDLATQVVIDAEPIGNPSDSGQLAPTAERLAPLLGVRPPAATAPPVQAPAIILVADAGYSSANDAIACEQLGFVPVFPVMRTVNPHGQLFNRTDFTHDAERDLMVCPAGKALAPKPKPQDGAIVYTARKTDCGACALKPQCTRAEKRTVLRLINEPALERVARRLKAEPTLMAKRAQSVEPAFGTLKRWLNGGRFLLRGRPKAKTELGLVTLAFNLKRLANLHGTATLQQALA
jgi:hypothetical protein